MRFIPDSRKAESVISIPGYDTDPKTQQVQATIDILDEVFNVNSDTFLYLFAI